MVTTEAEALLAKVYEALGNASPPYAQSDGEALRLIRQQAEDARRARKRIRLAALLEDVQDELEEYAATAKHVKDAVDGCKLMLTEAKSLLEAGQKEEQAHE